MVFWYEENIPRGHWLCDRVVLNPPVRASDPLQQQPARVVCHRAVAPGQVAAGFGGVPLRAHLAASAFNGRLRQQRSGRGRGCDELDNRPRAEEDGLRYAMYLYQREAAVSAEDPREAICLAPLILWIAIHKVKDFHLMLEGPEAEVT